MIERHQKNKIPGHECYGELTPKSFGSGCNREGFRPSG